jgi:two-component system nitrate/nitrite response regulator NarL
MEAVTLSTGPCIGTPSFLNPVPANGVNSNVPGVSHMPHIPPATPRVVIYDSSALQCDLLTIALESLRLGFEIQSANDLESLNALLTKEPNCVVIISDATMSGSTVTLTKQLRARFSELPFILLLQEGRLDRVIDAFRTGARGIVYSTENLDQLAKCVDCVSRGEVWVRPADLPLIFDGLSKSNVHVTDVTGRVLLSPREEEISKLVAEGMSNREVSRTLKISESTVKNSIFHVFEKLGISNRVELARYVNGASDVAGPEFRERLRRSRGPSASPFAVPKAGRR